MDSLTSKTPFGNCRCNLIPPRYDKIWYDYANEIYHLFNIQNDDNQFVGFADKTGKIIKDAIFKNMSCFNGNYAFVETAQGIGVIQQNGNYWMQPSPHALQQSNVNLNDFFAKAIDSLQKVKDIRYNIYLFGINYPYSADPIFKKIPMEQQLSINNLLVELYAPNYFLLGNRVNRPKTRSIRY
jgi:hypothetical protein